MARLNDFAAPAESVEALKRRFVRQNRDIVRVNSMQSLRIRSLESEVSHLLAENVSLREQIINLTQENERFESAKMLHEGVYEIKSRLDAKLAELSSLASELGMLPRKVGRPGGDKTGTDSDRPRATAESKPRTTDSEFNAGPEDGRLPAIVEDKYYPRRTLEQQEIQNLHAESSLESPRNDHSMREDRVPITESTRPELNDALSESRIDNSPLHDETALPPTLETRKKKKKIDSATLAYEQSPQNERSLTTNQPREPTKSGSKRKFSPDEDVPLADPAPEDDDFQFSRPGGSPQKKADPFDIMRQDLSPSKTPAGVKRGSAQSGITKRKVLEPKSSNSNLGSPRKMRGSLNPDNKGLPRSGADENTRSPQKSKGIDTQNPGTLNQKPRVARLGGVLQKPRRAGRPLETDDSFEPGPKATFPTDSPVAKAGDPAFGISDMNAASRPSRRRGAVVSYAEPNLRVKMRRPSKTMIDAVAGADPRRSSSFQLARDSLGNELDTSQSSASPHPSSNATRPADSVLSSQAADPFAQDDDSDQLLTRVSRRRRKVSSSNSDASDLVDLSTALGQRLCSKGPSRRHSSNPKSTSLDTLRREAEVASDIDSSFEADDTAYRRETRVAARRKSMMV
ncbi:hypothetical protein PEBR_22276 [Penicillium brasilianum]|uniref:Shugoshin n=1 Tax=Penicillium brasilianum TaxID=104259 RepID=A0A1S9RLE9_PENBI|nr:hypothetical protein PEBR_22276 [Penicillium brasilianum]